MAKGGSRKTRPTGVSGSMGIQSPDIASTERMLVWSLKLKVSIFFSRNSTVRWSRSMNVQCFMPRESASKPQVPVPEKMSRTFEFSSRTSRARSLLKTASLTRSR